jgi:SAM-dependent methyltransferase
MPTVADMQPATERNDDQMLAANQRFYDDFWSGVRLIEAHKFNTWPLVSSMLPDSGLQVEIAPGLRPRLPLEKTQFIDISSSALNVLRSRGASAIRAQISSLPFPAASFDLVCALDIVEHVDDDEAAVTEIVRIARPGAAILLSVPLHPSRWTAFDDFCGHRRRYEPEQLQQILNRHGLAVERSAVFGMQPKSSKLLDLGMWWMTHRRERAMWWYNRAIMPLSVRFQKSLEFQPGMRDATNVDELLLVCRKR